jgi:hypothetical protein
MSEEILINGGPYNTQSLKTALLRGGPRWVNKLYIVLTPGIDQEIEINGSHIGDLAHREFQFRVIKFYENYNPPVSNLITITVPA